MQLVSGSNPMTCIRSLSALVLLVSLTLSGCQESSQPLPAADARPVTEHRFIPSTEAPSKGLGADCRLSGHSECLSGLCLRMGPAQGGGYQCSQPCQQEADCPLGWACVPTLPGSQEAVCMPPPL